MIPGGTSKHPPERGHTSPAFVLLLDREGRIHFLSHVEEVHIDGEAIGSSGYACFVPESQAALREGLRTVFQERAPADCELVTAWGQHVSSRIALLNAERAIVICADITDRKRAEEALEESRNLLAAIVENIPDMIFVKDAATLRFVRLNKAGEQLLGYRSEDLLGKSDYDFFPEEEAAFFTAKDREVLEDGGVLDIPEEAIETRLRGKRVLHTKKVPILNEAGEPQYLLGISADITDQKRAEQERRSLEAQVQQSQKLESLGVMAGGIAHDFNNLLCGILMNADLVRAALPPASEAAASIEGVLQSTLQAAALTRQLLAYAGRGAFSFREVDLNSVVMETRSLIQTSISKKAHVTCELGEGLCGVEGDVSQLRQIVMNLVINASEALGDGAGQIKITTANRTCDRASLGAFELDTELPAGRYVSLSVSDSGCGMDEETRLKVFDPFFSTKFAGRGLGLAAILGIVRSHKGGIKVDSASGQGTTFTVLFPALDRAAAAEATRVDGDEESWRGSGTILLVDDEEHVRVGVVLALKQLGFSVLTAKDGLEAVDCFRAHKDEIRCVLLDLKMPGMDGEETLPELLRIQPEIPVILSSGYSEHGSARQLASRGFAGFLPKPYALAELRQKLREILET